MVAEGGFTFFLRAFAQTAPDLVAGNEDEENEQQNARPARQGNGLPGPVRATGQRRERHHDDRRQKRNRNIEKSGAPGDGNGFDDGAETQDEEQVEDVRADDVADGNFIGFLQGRRETHCKLRHRCAEGYDGETDQERGDAQTAGETRGTADKPFRTENETCET